MKEIRDIKIDLLTGNKNPIVELFNEITKDTMIIKCDVYHKHGSEFIYFANAKTAGQYHKDGEWIFYQDCQNGEFWCNYKRYWSLFESNLKLEYGEIQAITKYLVEEALKREVSTPREALESFKGVVEEALKREVSTPRLQGLFGMPSVEEALKREVSTPYIPMKYKQQKVEDALKREVGSVEFVVFTPPPVEEALKREIGTPHEEYFLLKIKVEEALKREVNQTE